MDSDSRAPFVLVVDDDDITRLLSVQTLLSAGIEVAEACDGIEALASVAQRMPDAILLDVMMPGLDGFQVCESLRSDPRTSAIPVLMMTALDDESSIGRAFGAGATDFITKPIVLSLLPHRLRYVLRAADAFHRTRLASARLAHAQRLARLAQWEMDLGSTRLSFAGGAEQILGGEATRAGSSVADFVGHVHADDRDRVAAAMKAAAAHHVEFRMVDAKGVERVFHQEAEVVTDETGRSYLLGATLDITKLKDAEQRVDRLANEDVATGLPNRSAFLREVEDAIGRSAASSRHVGVLFLGLDQLQSTSDAAGQEASDQVLLDAARFFARAGSRKPTLVARTGTRELALLLEDLDGPGDAASHARAALDALGRDPIRAPHTTLASAQVGIAMFPADASFAEALVDRAATALRHVPAGDRGGLRFYTAEIQADVERRLAIEAALRTALRDGVGIDLYYQPKVEVPSGRVTGVEALLRFTAPSPERVSPPELVQVAESAGLDVALGDFILRTACAQGKAWLDAGFRDVSMAINVTASQFRCSAFVSKVAESLAHAGLPPHLLQLEITEGTLMDDAEEAIAALAALRDLGVKIALDDFGTGYSSLAYLTRLPVDSLKIDRSFVVGLGTKPEAAMVAAAVVSLSQSLGLEVVAEGVETETQRHFFESRGRVTIQGWLFAKAMPSAEATKWIADRAEDAYLLAS